MAESAELYRIRDWASGFFDVNDSGEVVAIFPDRDGKETRVSLMAVIEEMNRLDLSLPVILRFPDILAARVRAINGAFREAMKELDYRNSYAGCFPIKVNQKREVISEITSLSDEFHFGFEAGTKAELIAAIAHLRDREAHLVCNGYKDEVFIDLALFAIKAGLKVVLVVERATELPLILDRAEALAVEPRLGLRVRIQSTGSGRWSTTSGGQGVFGLSPLEILRAVDILKDRHMLHCLYMVHYHQGSQIPDINTIRRGLEEAANLYIELLGEGAPLGAINIGGGLAIDYEGSAVISNASKNYSLKEYCETVVEVFRDYMNVNGLPHPVIISESGRAITSHYSTLVFNILDQSGGTPEEVSSPPADALREVHRIHQILEELKEENIRESVSEADALSYRCRLAFSAGDSSLRDLATVEKYRECLMQKVGRILAERERPANFIGPDLAMYYYANFSVFQSLPDAWAIGQLFPIMPIHRLNEFPSREGVIADITCDCDGKIRRYIGSSDEEFTLPLHPVEPGEPYYLGAFLVGAYQETLGDIHNLFGRPAVVSVRIQDGELNFERVDEGQTVAEVLALVDYSETELFDGFSDLADEAHSQGLISGGDRNDMMQLFGNALNSVTYLSPGTKKPGSDGPPDGAPVGPPDRSPDAAQLETSEP